MPMQTHQTPCIILRARPFQENTRILTFVTPTHGVLKGFARGGMRPNSRRPGAYEPLICGIMHFSTKETSDMVSLQKCDPHPPYLHLCASYEKICFASHFAALMERAPLSAEGYTDSYTLLLESLQAVFNAARLRQLPLIRLRFELKWLQLLGFSPLWERCPNCNASTFTQSFAQSRQQQNVPNNHGSREAGQAQDTALPASSVRQKGDHQFDASLGGVRCPDCVRPQNPHCKALPAQALNFLYTWQMGGAGHPSRSALQALLDAVTLHVVYQLESEPPSLGMLPQLDAL